MQQSPAGNDTSGSLSASELDSIISPEIKNDEFYRTIRELAREEDIKTVLEIGSSAGDGSTEAFVAGLRENRNKPTLFCIEVSRPRFTELKKRYEADSFVKCYCASSIPLSRFLSEEEVTRFYNSTRTALNRYPIDRVLGWLRQDIRYVKNSGAPGKGIQIIKRDNNIINFDMVLIDGSAFTSAAELDEVYGAKFILLDDINDIKNYNNYKRLSTDPNYFLVTQNWNLRNGYAVFKRGGSALPVHFFTIVLNGEPFIRHHIEVFRRLPFKWHWHIIEGVADLKHDTAWSLEHGGRISSELHRNGRSNDGTTEYLDELARQYPENITVYRKSEGVFWDGKLEMVNVPLANIKQECLLWQVDADELWTVEQICAARDMFIAEPDRTAAYYLDHFFVGENIVTTTIDTYGNNTSYEWLRTWRFRPGYRWAAHEPPRLCMPAGNNKWADIAAIKPFKHSQTSDKGLVFQHYAYATEKQLGFKEIYYGYKNAIAQWRCLQRQHDFPVFLRDYFGWVKDAAQVNTVKSQHITPIAWTDDNDQWHFGSRPLSLSDCKKALIVRPDDSNDSIVAERKYIIVSGYYADSKNTATFSISKEQFLDIWHENTLRHSKPKKIYLVNVSKKKPVKYYPEIDWIDIGYNLGHVGDFVSANDTNTLTGYALSVLIGMLLAYNNKADFIYKEQDCLAFGNWVDELYMEADRKGKVMLLGKGHLQGFIEQSLFLCKHDFLLEFVNQYLSFNTGDYPLLPEEKFRKIMEKLPSKIGLMDIGYGRIRPADFSDKVFFIQQPNDSELLELNNRGLIRQNKIKINFGCGSNRLRGWINHDIEVDLTKTLPYNDSEADYIFAEHVVEHLTLHEAYRFFRECFRILKPGGAIRITVPSISNVFHRKSGAYLRFLQAQNWGDGSDASAVESILFNHGHKSAWTDELLKIVLTNIGFKARTAEIYKSDIPDFIDVEGHQRIIGEEFNRIESISVEGSKEPCPFSDHTHRIDDQKFQNSDLRPAETFQGKLLGSDRRVLLVRTDAIGDFVIFSNVLPSFKTLHPEAKISILLQDTVAQLAQNCPYIDEIITFKASRIRDAQYRSEILAQLQSRHFEIAYYPVYSRDEIGDMLTLQSGAAKKVTFSGDCSNMPVQLKSNNDKNYDMLIPSVPGVLLETQRNREFMKGLGVDVPDSQGTCIWSNQKDEDFIVELLKNLNINNPIVISPFARLRIKDWPIEKWAQLLSHYPEESVLICAGPNDYERAQKLIGMSSHRHIYNLCGKTTLSQTAVLMRHCKLYIGVDTGPAHMAVAADVPNVVLMGGGHFGRFMPYSPSTTMVHCKVSCINCNWRCRFRTRTAPCLTQISVETVFRAIDAALCRPVCERKEPLVITDTLPYEPILYRIEDIKSIVEMYLLGLRLLRSNERDDARSVLEQTVKRLSPYMTIGVQWETLGEGEHYFDTVGCYISACTTLAQCYMQAGEFGKIKAVYQHLLQNPVLPFYDEQISELRSIIAKLQKVEPDNSVFAATALGASQKVQNLIPKPSHAAPKYLISAVISTYNSEKYIRGCLEDLENQTIADKLEIIVVNSASEQNEESVVKEFQNRYGNIVYIKTDKREGLYSAWNRAIKVASGQFLTSANTDDRHCKNALEVMASALLTSPDVALVYGDQIVTDTPNPTFENHHVIEAAKRPEFSIKRLLFGCCVGSQPMWRKSLHDEFGGFDETLSCASDWDFWLKIVGKYPFKHIPQCLGLYYRNEKGIEHGRKIHSLYERYAVGRRFGNPYISIIPLYKARDNPLVSVWMAVFNGEDYIARAIESVLIQNYRNFELIVVDDGSTDRTADIVRGFKNEPIKYFFKENGGAASARNFGLKKSGGSFIVMLDSDDMMMPGFIARHLAAFEQHPEVDLVYCDDCLINEQDDCIRIINRPEYPDQNAFISDLFRCGFPIVPFRTCIRKSVFDKIGLYDQRLIVGEDYDMIRRFAKQGLKMAHLPAALYLRRLTANGLSRSFNAAKAKSHFEVIRRFTETFTEEQLFPELCWEGLSVEQKQLQVKFRTAVAFIAIGRKYISSGASDYVAEAIDQACAQLGECLKVEPQNRQIGHLWQKCRAIRARQLQSARKLVYQSA